MNKPDVAVSADERTRVLRFTDGVVMHLHGDRIRIEVEGAHWEFDFWSLITRLRYEHMAQDRKQFAAMAMQGFIGTRVDIDWSYSGLAKAAVLQADELLKELAK